MWVVKEKRWRKSKKKGKHSRVGNSHCSSKDDYISLFNIRNRNKFILRDPEGMIETGKTLGVQFFGNELECLKRLEDGLF